MIAINHISIYKRDSDVGPQVLVASKQIYANHYFNAFLALTAFVNVPGATNGSYLVYENRSRADGLEGPFGKIKRGVVEKKALEGFAWDYRAIEGESRRVGIDCDDRRVFLAPFERLGTQVVWRDSAAVMATGAFGIDCITGAGPPPCGERNGIEGQSTQAGEREELNPFS